MTSLFKFIVFISAVIILISAVSVAVLYHVQPSTVIAPAKKTDAQIRVAVLNGCGREGLAASGARLLRSEGFDVVNGLGGNADSFDFDVSVIVDRKGDIEKARLCAKKTGIKDIIDHRSDNPYVIEDVVIILGRDWDTLDIFKEEGED